MFRQKLHWIPAPIASKLPLAKSGHRPVARHGCFRSYEQASARIMAGAKRVMIGAAPFDRCRCQYRSGVNDHEMIKILSSVSLAHPSALVPLLYVFNHAHGINQQWWPKSMQWPLTKTVLWPSPRDLRRAGFLVITLFHHISGTAMVNRDDLPHMAKTRWMGIYRVPTMDVAIDVTFTFW